MLNVPDWLDRLNRTTGYRELQAAFAEIAAQVQAGGEHAALARGIDEAIHRLESERTHDQKELQDFQARYESFRAENQGVVGWFKRHIPFTATRRQEHEHRDSVTQQAAEVLADNLVIARAQMIKERVLGQADRKLGERPDVWRTRLDAAAADRQLAAAAQVLKDIASQTEQSQAFLAAIKHDIEAFAGAEFKAAEDRQQRDADLVAARQELAALTREVHDKVALQRGGVKLLAARAAEELEAGDATFRADGQQLDALRTTLAQASEARTSLGALAAAATALGKLGRELKALPAEMQQARESLRRADGQFADANAALANKRTILDGQRGRFEAAEHEVEQARQVLASAQQFYDAYQAECRARQTMPVAAEASPEPPADSPMLRKFNEAKAAADAATARLREAAKPHDAAKKDVDTAQSALQEQQKQLDTLRTKLHDLERRGPQLRSELATATDQAQTAFAAAAAVLALYLASDRGTAAAPYRPQELAAGTFGCLGSQGLERGLADAVVQVERDFQRHLQGVQVLDRLNHWLDAQRQAIDAQRAAAEQRRQVAWSRRCTELLGEGLAKEACAAGLSS